MRLRSVTGVTSVADDSTVTTSVTGATKMSDNMRHQGIVDDCTACMKDQLAELRAELTSERMGAEWVNERLARSEERNAAVCYALTGGNPSLDGTASARLVTEILRTLRALDGGTE